MSEKQSGWLEELIEKSVREGWCTKMGCTTCGAIHLREALKSAVQHYVRHSFQGPRDERNSRRSPIKRGCFTRVFDPRSVALTQTEAHILRSTLRALQFSAVKSDGSKSVGNQRLINAEVSSNIPHSWADTVRFLSYLADFFIQSEEERAARYAREKLERQENEKRYRAEVIRLRERRLLARQANHQARLSKKESRDANLIVEHKKRFGGENSKKLIFEQLRRNGYIRTRLSHWVHQPSHCQENPCNDG